MKDTTPRFSIVIPTFNRPRQLERCVSALLPQIKRRSDVELLIVNDGGDERSLLQWNGEADVRCINRHINRGAAAARNLGVRLAAGDIILFTDDDCIPASDWVDAMATAWDKHPDMDGLGGLAVLEPSASLVSQTNAHLFNWYLSSACLSTFNASYRRSALDRMGGFDERFPGAAGEDRDLALRILAAGRRLAIMESLRVLHSPDMTLNNFLKKHAAYGAASRIIRERHSASLKLHRLNRFQLIRSSLKAVPGVRTGLEMAALLVASQAATLFGRLAGIFKSQPDGELPNTRRLDANLGYGCNNDCSFCYFKNRKMHALNKSTSQAKQLLRSIQEAGIKEVELTGGEVTIRPDIIDLISFAKGDLGLKVTIITNGSRFCDVKFARDAFQAGLDDILLSIHGHEPALHDKLVNRTGSFLETMKTIEIAAAHGKICRTNTVVSSGNFNQVGAIADLIWRQGIKETNFIFFSPLDDADHLQQMMVRYSDAAPPLQAMVQSFKDKIPTLSLKVIPFCFVPGLEDHVTNFFQNIYDPMEWDYFIRVGIRRYKLIRNAAALAGMLLYMEGRRLRQIGFGKGLREGIMHLQARRESVRGEACRHCRYENVCPGLWRQYARRFGTAELKPVPGEKVLNLDFSVRSRFKHLIYGFDTVPGKS